MANYLITVEQMINDALRLMDETGLTKAFADASPEEREEIIKAMNNMFGGMFPHDD